MASLETIELKISANAQEATRGLGKLISSLHALTTNLQPPISALKSLNEQLGILKGYSNTTFKNVMGSVNKTRSVKETTDAIKEQTKAVSELAKKTSQQYSYNETKQPQWSLDAQKLADERREKLKLGLISPGKTVAELQAEADKHKVSAESVPEAAKARYGLGQTSDIKKETEAVKEQGNAVKETTTAVKETTTAVKQETDALQKNSDALMQNSGNADKSVSMFSKLKEGFSKFVSGLTGIFSRIKRIAITMLIRSAIRNMIKDIREGVNNVKEWSKTVEGEGSSLAKAMNGFKAGTATMKNALGAMLSPVIQALIPLLNSLTNAIINAANWFNQFISLLSGKTSWTKAIQQTGDNVEETTSAVGNATKAAKEAIAAFDELNVLTAASGTGGSGGTTETTEDYSNMFEQISQFDEKIRGISEFVKENLETIKNLAGLVGTALLGWKLGNAFLDKLPVLSTIFGYVATGATIALTVGIDYMFMNEYMDTGKQGWFWASVLTTAVGSTAAWAIATKLIGGAAGAYAAGITLTLSAAADIKANVEHTDVDAFSEKSLLAMIKAAITGGLGIGIIASAAGAGTALTLVAAGGGALFIFGLALALKLNTQKNRITWGNLDLTEEQIKEYVQERMFTSGTNILINQLNTTIDEKLNLEQSISNALGLINNELDILKLGVDTKESYNRIKKLISGDDGSGGLVKDIEDLCDVNVRLLKLNVSNVTAYDGNGNPISTTTLLSGIQGWNKVKEEMDANGAELTRMLYEGATRELEPEEQKYVQELLEKVTGLSRKITQAQEFATTVTDFKTKALSAMNKGSVQGIIDAFKTFSSENEETIRKAWTETAKSYLALAELEDDPVLKKQYQDTADKILAGLDQTVAEELKKQNEPGVELVTEWLKNNVQLTNLQGIDYWIGVLQESGFTAEGFGLALKQLMLNNGVDPIVIEMMNLVDFGGWDMLSDELKEKFKEAIGKVNSADMVAELKKIGMSAKEVFQMSDWDKFTDDQKKEFVNAVKDAYGSDEALKAAKEAGIDIGEMLSDSVDGSVKDPEIGATADVAEAKAEGAKINDAVDGQVKDPTVGTSADVAAAKKTGSSLNSALVGKDGLNGTTKTVALSGDAAKTKTLGSNFNKWLFDTKAGFGDKTKPVALSGDATNTKALGKSMKSWMFDDQKGFGARSKKVTLTGNKKDTEGTGASMKSWFFDGKGFNGSNKKVLLSSDSKNLDKFKEDVDSKVAATRTVKIKADVGTDVGKSVGNSVGDAIKEKLKKVTISINTDGTIKLTVAASGAYGLKTGQLFIANEAGAEMVGSMDGKTAVANQEQIIEGIRRGVSDGQQEQNALLREQNRLLMGILQKSGNVTIGASSALGRVVNQSLQMYGQMTGV